MMRRALIAVAFSLFAAPAFSQTPELLAAAEQYVDTPAVQEIIRQSLSGPALANMVAEGFPANVQLSPEKWSGSAMSWPKPHSLCCRKCGRP